MFSVFPTLQSAISYTLYGSVKIGQFLVTTGHSLLTNCIVLVTKLYTVLTVIIEDFTIFLRDVIYNLDNIITSVILTCEQVIACITRIWISTSSLLHSCYNFVATTCNVGARSLIAFIVGIKNVLIWLKQVVIMFGDGVWFIAIYMPKSAIFLCLETLNNTKNLLISTFSDFSAYMKQLYSQCLKCMEDCYNFLTDVPAESLVGIVIAFCFLYILVQFYSIFYSYVRNKILLFFCGLKQKYNILKRTVFRLKSKTKREDAGTFQSKPESSKTSDDCGACIICQDHPKCILVLPCKHLCLCMDCTPRLMRYTGRCPICRRRISSTMKIFT